MDDTAKSIIKHHQIAELVAIAFGNDLKLSNRAIWVLQHCSDLENDTIKPYLNELILKLSTIPLSDMFKRCVLKICLNNDIPEKHQIAVLEICYLILNNPHEAIAIRSLCMPIIYNISKPYPELLKELTLVLKNILLEETTPALLAKARIVLKKIEKTTTKTVLF